MAARRSAPTLVLYSLVVLWFSREGHRHFRPTTRPWYASKAQASFAKVLDTLRAR